MSKLTFIFVHGLSGWGSYDAAYKWLPYWGMRGGDLMAFLRGQGFDCHAASVAPTGSAWDRACELYAQLTGTRTDYGEAHSQRCKHARFGPDFTGRPLIADFHEKTRLVLLGHSFGGATVRLLSELMAHGDAEERQAAREGELSPLFLGGMEERIHSIVALASPMNGTTAYDLFEDSNFDRASVRVPRLSRVFAWLMRKGTKSPKDGRNEKDCAAYDMHVDNALALNKKLLPLKNVYYFSVPCCISKPQIDGTYLPRRLAEPFYTMQSRLIGSYSGKTAGGVIIDERWRKNDGLVNTLSEEAPLGAPAKPLDKQNIEPGLWNVFPEIDGDHMWLQGGLVHRHDIKGFYTELLSMIAAL